MACVKCTNDPCTCQKTEKKEVWMITHCITPGCGVAIRYALAKGLGSPLCKWCQAGNAYNVRSGG